MISLSLSLSLCLCLAWQVLRYIFSGAESEATNFPNIVDVRTDQCSRKCSRKCKISRKIESEIEWNYCLPADIGSSLLQVSAATGI